VKVVEGSEIYNFPIHHLVHFYTNFWSKSQSNQPAQQRVTLERDVAPRPRAHDALASAPSATLLGWLYCPRPVPRSLAPSRGRLEVSPSSRRAPADRTGAQRTTGRFRAPLLCTPAEAAARTSRPRPPSPVAYLSSRAAPRPAAPAPACTAGCHRAAVAGHGESPPPRHRTVTRAHTRHHDPLSQPPEPRIAQPGRRPRRSSGRRGSRRPPPPAKPPLASPPPTLAQIDPR
jgi:hypothetical protein